MHQTWIIAYISIVIIVAHGYAEDLVVSITPISYKFNEEQDVEVILNYKNSGSKPVSMYNWYVPEEELTDPLFDISRDGKNVKYVGPLMKRVAPTEEDIITIQSGADVSTHVKISSVYNMTKTGNYSIRFKAFVDPTLVTSSRKRRADGTPFVAANKNPLESTPTSVFVVGRRNALIERSVRINSEARAASITYSGCSTSQKQPIPSAVQAASRYASGAVQYLSASRTSGTPRYTTWFGTFSSNNYNTLRTHFNKINDAINNRPLRFDCSTCKRPKTFAYVHSDEPYTIYLCDKFWPAAVTGTDSKGGTVVHELSHFTVIADTDDVQYGQDDCKALARTNPRSTIVNADSHEYFAENNPPLQ